MKRKKKLTKTERKQAYRSVFSKQTPSVRDDLNKLAYAREKVTKDPEGMKDTAHHESLHAVMYTLFDFPLEYVSCLPQLIPAGAAGRDESFPISAGLCFMKPITLNSEIEKLLYAMCLLAPLVDYLDSGMAQELANEHCKTDIDKADRCGEINKVILNRILKFIRHPEIAAAVDALTTVVFQKDRVEENEISQITRTHVDGRRFVTRDGWKKMAAIPGFNAANQLMEILSTEPLGVGDASTDASTARDGAGL